MTRWTLMTTLALLPVAAATIEGQAVTRSGPRTRASSRAR